MKSGFPAWALVILLILTAPGFGEDLSAKNRPSTSPRSAVRKVRANCGPIVLQKLFKKHGIDSKLDDLVRETDTRQGLTTLFEMKQAVLKKGLYAEGIQTDLKTLSELLKNHDVICHFTENNHYILVESIDEREVKFFDPAWVEQNQGNHAMWRSVFEKEWKGICLVVSAKPLGLADSKSP